MLLCFDRPGRARTQVQFVPRTLKKAPETSTSSTEPGDEATTSKIEKPKLSNADFRKMLNR